MLLATSTTTTVPSETLWAVSTMEATPSADCEWMDDCYLKERLPCESESSLHVQAVDPATPIMISLGCFCGVKFSIQKLGLGAAHLPFDWMRTRIGAVLRFLRTDFEGFFDTQAPVELADVGGDPVFRSQCHSFWHDDIHHTEVRKKLMRRIERLKSFACPPLGLTPPPLLFIRALATTGELAQVDELHAELVERFSGGVAGRVFLLAIVGYQTRLNGPFLSATTPGLLLYCASIEIHRTASEYPYCGAIEWALKHIRNEGAWVHTQQSKTDTATELLLSPMLDASEWGLKGWCGRKSFIEDNRPQMLQPLLIHRDPPVTFFYDFVTAEDVDHLITMVVDRWVPSARFHGTCMEATLEFAQTAVVERIEGRVANVTGFSMAHVDKLMLVRYTEGQFCEAHNDGPLRSMTVFVFLSDVAKGGKTSFPELGIEIQPSTGTAVMWSNTCQDGQMDPRVVHESLAVGEGCVKYGIYCFVSRDPLFRPRRGTEGHMFQHLENVRHIDSRLPLGYSSPDNVDLSSQCEESGQVLFEKGGEKPKMAVFPDFLSAAECDHLIGLAENSWAFSMVTSFDSIYTVEENGVGQLVSETNTGNSVSEDRTSTSSRLRPRQTDVVEAIEHRLARVAGLPEDHLESLFMVRYRPGEFFCEHHDGVTRPKTCFIYLNDLPDSDNPVDGHTYFPRLGLSIVPRRGSMVMWENLTSEGKEDGRMNHVGLAPQQGIKYGVNCFFSSGVIRINTAPCLDFSLENAAVVNVYGLGLHGRETEIAAEGVANESAKTADEPATIKRYVLSRDPKISAIPGFLTTEEAVHLLEHVGGISGIADTDGPHKGGSRLLHCFEQGETRIVERVEMRLAILSHEAKLSNLGRLRLVRSGSDYATCDRGGGSNSAYICLCDQEEVFFIKVGIRLKLRRGDMIHWPNVTVEGQEDMRTLRMHRMEEDMTSLVAIGLEVSFYAHTARQQ